MWIFLSGLSYVQIMEQKNYYTGLILKYLAGEILPPENQDLQNWLAEDEENQKLFLSIQENWNATNTDTLKSELAYQQLSQKLGIQPESTSPAPQQLNPKKRNIYPFWLKIAATFTGLLLIASVTYYNFFRIETIRYETGYGETATFNLPDHSVVTLNANSALSYNTDWKQQTSREVWLNGEAFFHVKKVDQGKESSLPAKFIVHTSQLNVEVLGTQFNVNERHGKTTVVLNSGKVKLNSILNTEALVMEPGEYVELTANHQHFIKKVVDPEIYSSWKHQKLILDNTTLQEIAQVIEDYFGLDVIIEDQEAAQKSLTGSIPTNDLETFITVLSASTDVEIKIERNKLILRNKDVP